MAVNQSVTRAVVILEYPAEADEPRDLAVISRDLSMNKSTVYRFLSSLAEFGYARQDLDTSQHSLGARVIWLGYKFLENIDIRRIARPILEQLSSKTGETVHMGFLEGYEVFYIDKITSCGAILDSFTHWQPTSGPFHHAWYAKSRPTFSDALAPVHQQLWISLLALQTLGEQLDIAKVSRSFYVSLIDTLCCAA